MIKQIGWFCLFCSAAFAQTWEVGGIGGYGMGLNLKANGPAGSADAGIRPGGVVGVFVGEDTYKRWGGELRYMYRFGDLKLSSGNADVHFGSNTQILEANFMYHFASREASVRPFFAFGGGIKRVAGTGIESARQPLGRLVALTNTNEVLPVLGVGFGIKRDFGSHLRLRLEGRDYISPTPKNVIAPAPGATVTGVMNDFVALLAISYKF